jgi:hypothetical protein
VSTLPPLSGTLTLLFTTRLLSLALVLQALELLSVRRAFSEQGVFAWSELRRDFARSPARPLLDLLLSYRGFFGVLLTQLLLALLMPLTVGTRLGAPCTTMLLGTVLLVGVRFRGSYNGGSDAMTLVVLLGVLAAQCGYPRLGLGYIAAQVVLSYFVAGLSKLRSLRWRQGSALSELVVARQYVVPAPARRLLGTPWVSRLGGWAVMGFECAFPLSLLLGRTVALGFVLAGLCFHLAIVGTLGLNRFFWAWLAAYPALLYFSEPG